MSGRWGGRASNKAPARDALNVTLPPKNANWFRVQIYEKGKLIHDEEIWKGINFTVKDVERFYNAVWSGPNLQVKVTKTN